MFAHIESDVCKFKSLCLNKLCSYQHSIPEKEMNSFECQQCELVLDTHNLLINHVQKIHVEEEKYRGIIYSLLSAPIAPNGFIPMMTTKVTMMTLKNLANVKLGRRMLLRRRPCDPAQCSDLLRDILYLVLCIFRNWK